MNYIEINESVYDALADEFKQKITHRFIGDKQLTETFHRILSTRFSSPLVLDIGPGNGNMIKLLSEKGCITEAIDISSKMAKVAKDNSPETNVLIGDFLTFNFGDRRFSGIIASAFVHLFNGDDLERVIKKMKSLLLDNGLILLSTTKHSHSAQGYEVKTNFNMKVRRFRRRFTKSEVSRLIEQCQLQVVKFWENADDEEKGKVWMNFILEKRTP